MEAGEKDRLTEKDRGEWERKRERGVIESETERERTSDIELVRCGGWEGAREAATRYREGSG